MAATKPTKEAGKSPISTKKSPARKAAATAVKSKNTKVSADKVTKASHLKCEAKAISASDGIKEKPKGGSSNKTTAFESSNKFESLLFEDPSSTSDDEASEGHSTPRKFLFGPKSGPHGKEETKANDADEESESDQCQSDEYEAYDTDEEDVDNIEVTVKHNVDDDKAVGPYHPSVPQSRNNMEKYKLRQPVKGEKDPNGRYHGRKLVPWHRERMMEKLLVFLDYECHLRSVKIPWDEIMHRYQTGASGPSAAQFIEKMRLRLIVEGHMVPPEKQRLDHPYNNKVRGLIRADRRPGANPGLVRIVRWDEKFEHPKKSLGTAGITNGSGKYSRGGDSRTSKPKSRRDESRLKVEYPDDYVAQVKKIKEDISAKKTKARRERAKENLKLKRKRNLVTEAPDAEERGEIADPADLSADEEYQDHATKKPRRSAGTSGTKKKVSAKVKASAMMPFGLSDDVTSKEIPTLPVRFTMSPRKLAKFPAGQSGRQASELQKGFAGENNTAVSAPDMDEGLRSGDNEHEEGNEEIEEGTGDEEDEDEDEYEYEHEGEGEDDGDEVEEGDQMDAEYFEDSYAVIESPDRLNQYYTGLGDIPQEVDDFGNPLNYSLPRGDDMFSSPQASQQQPYDYGVFEVSPGGQMASSASQNAAFSWLNGYDVSGAVEHENYTPVPPSGMTFDQPELMIYEDPMPQFGANFRDFAITPEHHHYEYFDEQDENVPPGGSISPPAHGQDHDEYSGFGGPLFQQ